MGDQQEKVSVENKSIKEVLKENQKAIIANKEKFYDKMIDKLHITTLGIDIFIAIMIILLIVIIVTQGNF